MGVIVEENQSIKKDAVIKVVGVGGGGNNAVNRMIEDGIADIEFIALNTDYHVLEISKASKHIQLGQKLTRGLGAGGSSDVGRKAAEETKDEIEQSLEGADLVFVTAGMGGGTGTGAAPIVAQIAKSKGILTIGVVTTPFSFEGRQRMESAQDGLVALKSVVDSLIVIPNEKLMELSDENLTLKNAFKKADNVLVQGVRGIYDIINKTADINVDFADVSAVTRNKGVAHMGVGTGSGKNKTEIAIKTAINSPLLDTSISGAKSVLINFTTDENTPLKEINDAVNIIRDIADPNAHIFFGCTNVEDLDDYVSVTVIATGLDDNNKMYNSANATVETVQSQPVQVQQEMQQPQGQMDNQFQGQPQGQMQAQAQPQMQNQGLAEQQTQQYNPNDLQSTGQFATVNYDTMPSIQPVSYESDRAQQSATQRTDRFKIHKIFSQGGVGNLPDIER